MRVLFAILLSMITKVSVYKTESTNVFVNQAIELALFDAVAEGELILYLWSNENCVVIGRNQDAFAEVNVALLEAEGGLLARRLSGGGAVFHDSGNVNFTFIAHSRDFDVEKNRSIVLSALKKMGLNPSLTGRNDIEVDGAKVSGNAYFKKNGRELHHGTMLISSASEKVARYLTPTKKKFAGKKVKSVVSRVGNLQNYLKTADSKTFVESMESSLRESYPKATYAEIAPVTLGAQAVVGNSMFFAADDWRYGKKTEYNLRFDYVFDGANCELALLIKDDIIQECDVFSDDMNFGFAEEIVGTIKGANVNSDGNIFAKIREEWNEI